GLRLLLRGGVARPPAAGGRPRRRDRSREAPSHLSSRAALRPDPHVRPRARVPRRRSSDLARGHAPDPAARHGFDAPPRHDVPELPAVPAPHLLPAAARALPLLPPPPPRPPPPRPRPPP